MSSKNKQITPRKYLSWSQLNLFEKSPKEYSRLYLEGRKRPDNKYIQLGKKLADRLETGLPSGDKTIEHVVNFLPKTKKQEFEITVSRFGVPLLGRLDGFDPRSKKITEHKTGKKWTQKMVDSLGQLTFYSCLVWAKYKVLPKKIVLHWLETKENEFGELYLTGKIKTFKTKRAYVQIALMSCRIKKAWKGIKKLTKEYGR